MTVVSGHPLIIGSAIDSVRRWKFRSYAVNGLKKSFCGKVAVRYVATDSEVKYEVIKPLKLRKHTALSPVKPRSQFTWTLTATGILLPS